jgi:hypothetical protein
VARMFQRRIKPSVVLKPKIAPEDEQRERVTRH